MKLTLKWNKFYNLCICEIITTKNKEKTATSFFIYFTENSKIIILNRDRVKRLSLIAVHS